MQKRSKTLIPCLIAILYGLLSPVLASDSISKTQLQKLERELESQRKLNHIPGLSVAVVKDGEVIYANGFGFKDVKQQLPVTKDTLFPIGSVSKSFTSILAGIRVDDGVINWDDKLVTHLPDYQFTQNAKTIPLTLRDALSHKTGYGRNDTLWARANTSRAAILKAAPLATPVAEYGTEYHYNNVMYLAAGLATAHDNDFNWDGVLQNRLLKPLQMRSTTTDHAKVSKDTRLSKGYYWDDIDQQFHELPLRDLYNIAPAGGIYSNAQDMTKWLTLILSKGKVQNKQLIKPETLQEIVSPMNNISPTYDYGMGWSLAKYNGELLIEHAGSIEGYAAQIALLPDSGIGFIILMNVSISPLQPASINLVFDALTLDPDSDGGDSPADYSQYVGDYLANFWQFQNVYFRFQMHGDKPALNIPGQTLYMLKPPDDEGKFYFEITNNVAVSFQLNEQNEVINMVHHEEEQAFILPKREAESPQATDAISDPSKAVVALYKSMNIRKQKTSYEKLQQLEITGTVLQQQSGVTGQFRLVANGLTWHLEQDFGNVASLRTKVEPTGGVNKRLRHDYQLKGYLHEQALREHPFHFLYWDKIYQSISTDNTSPDVKQISVALEGFELSSATAKVSPTTGHVQSLTMPFIDPVWGQYSREISYFDYQPYCGLDIPGRFVVDDHETGKSIFIITQISSKNCTK